MNHSFYIYLSNVLLFLSLGLFVIISISYLKKINKNIKNIYTKDFRELESVNDFYKISLAICLFVLLFLLYLKIHVILALIIASSGMLIFPKAFKKRAKNKIMKAFDQCLPDSLLSLVSSLDAGLTLHRAFLVAAEATAPPFAFQAKTLLNEYKLGIDIDNALKNIIFRMPTASTKTAFGALIVGRQLGGPLPIILRKIAMTIRERERVEGRLRALTSQGKSQGMLVCSMPVFVFIGMAILSPQKMQMLTSNLVGQILLVAVFVLEIIGIVATFKVLRLDI